MGEDRDAKGLCLSVTTLVLRVLVIGLSIAAFNTWQKDDNSETWLVEDDYGVKTCYIFLRERVNSTDIKEDLEVCGVPMRELTRCEHAARGDSDARQGCNVYPYVDVEKGTHQGATDMATGALVAAVILLAAKCAFVFWEARGETWVDEVEYKFSKGIVFVISYLMVTFSLGIVLSPITTMKTYGNDEVKGAAEVQLQAFPHVITMVFAPLAVFLFFLTLFLRQFCSEKDGCLSSCGWCVLWGPPGFLVLLNMIFVVAAAVADMPTFDFGLIFSFNVSFASAAIADVVQLLIFAIMLLDGVQTVDTIRTALLQAARRATSE